MATYPPYPPNYKDPLKSSPIGGHDLPSFARMIAAWPTFCSFSIMDNNGVKTILMQTMEKEAFKTAMHQMVDNLIVDGKLDANLRSDAKAVVDREISGRMGANLME
jgi:hypothetical protein